MFHGAGPGRPKGLTNKVSQEVREAARGIIDEPEYRRLLALRVASGEAPHMETLLWHYGYGKPKETVEVSGEDGGAIEMIQRVVIRPEEKP